MNINHLLIDLGQMGRHGDQSQANTDQHGPTRRADKCVSC